MIFRLVNQAQRHRISQHIRLLFHASKYLSRSIMLDSGANDPNSGCATASKTKSYLARLISCTVDDRLYLLAGFKWDVGAVIENTGNSLLRNASLPRDLVDSCLLSYCQRIRPKSRLIAYLLPFPLPVTTHKILLWPSNWIEETWYSIKVTFSVFPEITVTFALTFWWMMFNWFADIGLIIVARCSFCFRRPREGSNISFKAGKEIS